MASEQSSAAAQKLVVGKITSCYGVKGWVKIHAYTEQRQSFLDFGQWHVERHGKYEPVNFDEIKLHGKGLVAHIVGVEDRTAAEAYTGMEVAVAAEALPALEEGDYYWRDLEGLQVWCFESQSESTDIERVLLGNVDSLIETGANDVLVVKATKESYDDQERLIPYVPGSTVRRVDLAQGIIEVDWFLEED